VFESAAEQYIHVARRQLARESVFIKKESVNVLLMNPVGGGTTEVNEALLDRTAVISVPEPSIDDLSLLFNSDVVEETEFEDLSVLNPLEIKKLTRDQKSMVIDFFKPFKLSIRQFKEIFWFLENSPFPAQRLADFIKNRVDLNIIQSKQFSMIQIEKTEIPELIRYLDYPMF